MAIRKEFWRLAWPAAAEGLLLMLLTAADLLMVSALGNTAVAAVSIFSQPRMVILCVTRSYSVALSAYVARRRGKHPDESLTSCSRASLMLGCGLSMLLLVGTWIGAGPLLRLAGAQDDYINLGYLFFSKRASSLALFELWGQYEELRAGGLIDYPALMNYIWAHFPEYAATYNIQNQMGMHDTFGLLMNALGTEVELQNNPNKVIAMSKAAGLDFLNF